MANVKLIGLQVSIVISDPWDFMEKHRDPLVAEIVRVGTEGPTSQTGGLLLRLNQPVVYQGTLCEYFLALPRYESDKVKNILTGEEMLCALTLIPQERVISNNPFDLSWWRGGIGFIASLRKLKT